MTDQIVLTQTDCDALELAIKEYLADTDQQIEPMLKHSSRVEVGLLCAYSCQHDALQLEPWDTAPMDADENDANAAGQLLRRMLSAGVSRYAPDPVAAIDAAGSQRRRRQRSSLTSRVRGVSAVDILTTHVRPRRANDDAACNNIVALNINRIGGNDQCLSGS